MNKPTHILHLEDDDNDAELVRSMFEAAGMVCQITRVQTGPEFGDALEKGRFDLILADYRLPGYDGVSALHLARGLCSDIPFIFVSGTMGEDAAIEGLIRGATDYVLKNKLARLAPSVARALRDAENQRERKRAEESLRKLSRAVEQSPASIVITNTAGIIEYVNPKFTALTGYTLEEAVGRNPRILKSGQTPSEEYTRLWRTITSGGEWRGELCNRKKNGELYWESVSISPVLNEMGAITHFVAVKEDITERKRADEQIRASLAEKETLLRELYHRTKNNMAVITALLALQADFIDDPRIAEAFTGAQNRIFSMALVHQKLYEAQDLSRINLMEYINDLAVLLMKSYQVSPDRLRLVSEMEPVWVLIDTAIPCGLVLNELISNALKHAFPNGREGEIRIRLRRMENREIQLSVADNGIGVPEGFDFRQDGRLGLQNIFAVGEKQLHAKVVFQANSGVMCQLQFADDFYEPRI